jgi:cold shock CspA family protein
LRGKIDWFNASKGYGFVSAADGEKVFLHKDQIPQGISVKEGDEIEFEKGQGTKGPKAIKVKLLAKGSGKPATNSNSGKPNKAQNVLQVPKGIAVDIVALNEDIEGDKIIVPVWVIAKKDNAFLVGTKVELSADGKKVTKPIAQPTTDGSGKAIFAVSLAKNTERAYLVVKVMGKSYTFLWQSGEGASEPPKPENIAKKKEEKEEPETLEIISPTCPNADNSFQIKVVSKKGSKAEPNVKFNVSANEILTVKTLQGSTLGKNRLLELTTSPDGSLTFVLHFKNPVQTQTKFNLPNGFSHTVTLVKLPERI